MLHLVLESKLFISYFLIYINYLRRIKKVKVVSRFVKYYLLPLMVVLVASIQLYRTETGLQSRWKGGGFGMYTSINESNGFVLVNKKKYDESMLANIDAIKKFHLEKNLLYYPSEKHAQEFYGHLKAKKDTTLIEVYQPVMDARTRTLVYKAVYEHTFTKN